VACRDAVRPHPRLGLLLDKAYADGKYRRRRRLFPEAFERAVAEGRPALLELRVDPEAITPRQTITEIRSGARR
jgi:acetolactate synthase-1/2/3 large subunit